MRTYNVTFYLTHTTKMSFDFHNPTDWEDLKTKNFLPPGCTTLKDAKSGRSTIIMHDKILLVDFQQFDHPRERVEN